MGPGFSLLRLDSHGVVTSAGLDSGLVHASLDVVSIGLARQALLLHLEGGALRNPVFGEAFDPWVTQNGPRGFGAHVFTGTRLVYAVLEDRVLLSDALFGVLGVGAAPYVEYGGAGTRARRAAGGRSRHGAAARLAALGAGRRRRNRAVVPLWGRAARMVPGR